MGGSERWHPMMKELHMEAMELRLGLPGCAELTGRRNKRSASSEIWLQGEEEEESSSSKTNIDSSSCLNDKQCAPPSKAEVVGWPPIRRNSLEMMMMMMRKSSSSSNSDDEAAGGMRYNNNYYVKVRLDGSAYLRKIDLKVYGSYKELLRGLEDMLNLTIIGDGSSSHSHFSPTYQHKDGDWMLLGDVPWEMFISTCKTLRIIRSGSQSREHLITPITTKLYTTSS